MATAVTTFAFATTLQSWSSIAALASGETNGLDTVNGNPADALFGKLVGKTKATTAGAGMKLSQTLTAWGVPAGATVTAVSVALDKKCVTAPGSAIGSGSFNTKLSLNAGASTNTGPTQTLSTTADSVWTTLGTGSNAALSGLTDTTLTHTLEVDILYTLSTTSSALTSTTWQIDWDNVVVTVTYTVNVPTAPATPTGTGSESQVALTWTDNANNGGASVTDHHVYIYDAPSGGTLLRTVDTLSATTSATVSSLTDGVVYYFEVTATNSAGESAHSSRSAAVYPLSITRVGGTAVFGDIGPNVNTSLAAIPPHTQGDLLVLYLNTNGAGASSGTTFTDATNAWTHALTISDGTCILDIWTAQAATTEAGSTTISLSSSASTDTAGSAFRSSQGLLQLDVTGTGSGATSATVSTGTATDYTDELVLTASLHTNSNPPAGYTIDEGDSFGGSAAATEGLASAYVGVGATGTQSATWTSAGTVTMAILTFTHNSPVARSQKPVLQAVNRSNTY